MSKCEVSRKEGIATQSIMPRTVGEPLAYVFEQDGSDWQQTGILYADDAGPDRDGFGASVVALDRQQVAVGAPQRDEAFARDGAAVYLFQARGVSAQGGPEPATLSLLVVGLLGWWSCCFR